MYNHMYYCVKMNYCLREFWLLINYCLYFLTCCAGESSRWRQYVFSLHTRSNIRRIFFYWEEITSVPVLTGELHGNTTHTHARTHAHTHAHTHMHTHTHIHKLISCLLLFVTEYTDFMTSARDGIVLNYGRHSPIASIVYPLVSYHMHITWYLYVQLHHYACRCYKNTVVQPTFYTYTCILTQDTCILTVRDVIVNVWFPYTCAV